MTEDVIEKLKEKLKSVSEAYFANVLGINEFNPFSFTALDYRVETIIFQKKQMAELEDAVNRAERLMKMVTINI